MSMKNISQDKWTDGIGEIADSYILEAINYSKQKKKSRGYIRVAAIIFVCICASVSVLVYRENLSTEDGQDISSVKEEENAGALSVIAYAATVEPGQGEEKGTKLEEDVEVHFSEYSPYMSHIPAMPFSFEYSGRGKEVEIKVSTDPGILQKYEVDENSAWHISEQSEVLYCKSGEKIYWSPTEGGQKKSVLTVEVFLDNVLQEKKEISIKGDETDSYYTAILTSKEGMESSHRIVDEAMKFTQRMGVYAPDLLIYNQDYLAFANLRGMLIYDLRKEKLASVIDLQEMDCNNFLSDRRNTCVIEENNEILLFNMESGKIEQNYYRCSFPNGLEEPKIEMLDTKGEKQMLKKKYEDYQKNRRESNYQEMYEKYIEKWSSYSEYGICWENEQGEQIQSTLLIEYSDIAKQEIYYSILHENLEKGTWEKQKLNIDVAVEKGTGAISDVEKLPEYQYTGKNEIKKAIYNYVPANAGEEIDKDMAKNNPGVLIPYLAETYGVFDKGDQVVFFGKIFFEYYTQVGDILYSMDGGSMTFKAVLQKKEEGYSVKKFKIAEGDGGLLMDSIKKLMKGYPEAKKALEASTWDDDVAKKEKKRVISRYVKNNDLMIHYYKDYGWDKVKLSD